MKRLLIAGLAAAAIALGACGGDEGEDTAATTADTAATGAPQATESIDDAVAELNEAIANGDCEAIVATTFSALRESASGDGPAEPGEPAAPDECAKNGPASGLLAEIEGTIFEESEDYGAAAISQGSGGKPVGGYEDWSVVWMVDRDGEYRHVAFFPADPQFDEDLPAEADPVGVTEQLVTAVQNGDCSTADDFMGDRLRFGESPEAACETIAGGSIFAPAVKSAEDVTVEEIGASRDYAVVGVDTGETYFGVLLATPPIAPDKPVQDVVLVNDVVALTDFEIVEAEEAKKS